MNETVTFDSAMTRLKKLVYKQRIRLKDFFVVSSCFLSTDHFCMPCCMHQNMFNSVLPLSQRSQTHVVVLISRVEKQLRLRASCLHVPILQLNYSWQDFDKLHTGFVATNHFITALSMAGIDKHLSSSELETLRDAYKQTKGPSLILADYRSFLADVDIIFTVPVRVTLIGFVLQAHIKVLVQQVEFWISV